MWVCLVLLSQVLSQSSEHSVFVAGTPSTWRRVKPVRSSQSQYFLRATEEIHPGDVVASVPLSLAITSFDSFPLSPLFSDDTEEHKIIARMLYERFYGANGTFSKRWVDTFPEHPTNLFLWSDSDLQQFQRYDAFGLYNSLANISSTYPSFSHRMRLTQTQYSLMTTQSAYLWGKSQFFKRCFSLLKTDWKLARKIHVLAEDEGVEGIACYPLLDLAGFCKLEDSKSPQSLCIDSHSISVVLKSEFEFRAGQRFCMSLSGYNSFELLLFQGLAFPYNPFDTLKIGIPMKNFGCKGEIQGEMCQFTITTNVLSASLLAQLRSSRANKEVAVIQPAVLVRSLPSLSVPAQTDLIQSLLAYRSLLLQSVFALPQHSLRSEARQAANSTSAVASAIHTFAVSVWAGPYVHRAKVERLTLKLLLESLGA